MLALALTPDARLRLLEERDADELYALIDADRAYLAGWMPWAAGQTLRQAETIGERSHDVVLYAMLAAEWT